LGVKGKGAIAARLRFARHIPADVLGRREDENDVRLAAVGFTAAQGV
jgi:hypothetical protein